MFPVGGVGVMLLGVLVAGVGCGLLGLALRRRLGGFAATNLALLLWSLATIGFITLLPANGAPGIVSAEGRLTTCSWDYGGPAPDGFWIFSGGQRLLNAVVFVAPGLFLVLLAARWRWWALLWVPLGVALLSAYSVAIEFIQLEVARIDRACDVTDIVDNTAGAVIGAALGLLAVAVLQPWRNRVPESSEPSNVTE